jgi:hypothetical protein
MMATAPTPAGVVSAIIVSLLYDVNLMIEKFND